MAVIAGLIIAALLALALTNQGSAFKHCCKIPALNYAVWLAEPNKKPLEYTWQVAVVAGILAFIVCLLDTVFSQLIQYVIGQ